MSQTLTTTPAPDPGTFTLYLQSAGRKTADERLLLEEARAAARRVSTAVPSVRRAWREGLPAIRIVVRTDRAQFLRLANSLHGSATMTDATRCSWVPGQDLVDELNESNEGDQGEQWRLI